MALANITNKMKIHEILTEDAEQLDELNWKKAAAAATLAGASLLGGSQADAQTDPKSHVYRSEILGQLVDRLVTYHSKEEFIENIKPQDIMKMAYYIGRLDPYSKERDLDSELERKYRSMKTFYNKVFHDKLNDQEKLAANTERKKGYDETRRGGRLRVGGGSDWSMLPEMRKLEDLYNLVVNRKDNEATANMTSADKHRYYQNKIDSTMNRIDKKIAAGNSPEAQERHRLANKELAVSNKMLDQEINRSTKQSPDKVIPPSISAEDEARLQALMDRFKPKP